MEKELRYLPNEIKADGNTVTGLAIVYNSPSKPLQFNRSTGSFIEVIKPGAGASVISGDTLALYEHDTKSPLGRNGSNLTLTETNAGISYSLILPDTTLGRDIKQLVNDKILRGASFFLDVPKGGDKWSKVDGQLYRHINKLNSLPEISLVINPAYPDTSAALRSYQEFEEENKAELEANGLLETSNKQRLLIINRLMD